MKIYNYNRVTKVYTKQTDARPDPENKGEFLIPAYASLIIPPIVSSDEEAHFDIGWKVRKIKTSRPSKYHTWGDNTGWVITLEDQILWQGDKNKKEVEIIAGELRRQQESLIQNKIRKIAIDVLKIEGKLPEGYDI